MESENAKQNEYEYTKHRKRKRRVLPPCVFIEILKENNLGGGGGWWPAESKPRPAPSEWKKILTQKWNLIPHRYAMI